MVSCTLYLYYQWSVYKWEHHYHHHHYSDIISSSQNQKICYAITGIFFTSVKTAGIIFYGILWLFYCFIYPIQKWHEKWLLLLNHLTEPADISNWIIQHTRQGQACHVTSAAVHSLSHSDDYKLPYKTFKAASLVVALSVFKLCVNWIELNMNMKVGLNILEYISPLHINKWMGQCINSTDLEGHVIARVEN